MERRNFLTVAVATGVGTSLAATGGVASARPDDAPAETRAELSATERWLLGTGTSRRGENLAKLVS
ncbi:hypothetical protein O7599_02490 [Streptomyces sp. WMMC500]|uniref:hypothetical protein n=1 Tax=Streptomyces sp. WMMC500 TaxID=3015154 RepID=UPI00248AA49B|nr:hypothetical protein [Streptomyces sp. WMMC500]WBB61444.1 hypothetical protein O7599_02490 [Streptomyces sp. WMMC500]